MEPNPPRPDFDYPPPTVPPSEPAFLDFPPPTVPAPHPGEAAPALEAAPGEKVIERPSPLTGLAHSGIVLAGSVFLFVRELGDGGLENLGGMALVVGAIALGSALIALLAGLAAWRTTTFIVDDEEFRVERRFLWSSSSRVDYTKVQSIEINQPFVARLLGLARVQIDVGGAGGVNLQFLTMARAEALREHLLQRMRRAKAPWAPPPSAVDAPVVPHEAPPPAVEPEILVHQVPLRTLFVGTLLSSFAISAGLTAVILLILYLWQDISVTVFGALIAVAGWLWANIAGNWNFTVTRRGDSFRIKRGLTSTSAQSLRPERIQAISIRQDLFQRITGLYRMRVTVLGNAGSVEEDKIDTSVLLPFGTWEDVLKHLHLVWPHVDLNQIVPNPQPSRARWLTPLSFSQHTWGVGPDVVVAHHGLIEHTMSVVPHERMQSLSISQGPLQRKLRLASVALHTTDGPVGCTLYHLDQDVARRVFDDQLIRGREARERADA